MSLFEANIYLEIATVISSYHFALRLIYLYTWWWKPQYRLKPPVFCLFFLDSLCSIAVCRHESGRGRSFFTSFTYFSPLHVFTIIGFPFTLISYKLNQLCILGTKLLIYLVTFSGGHPPLSSSAVSVWLWEYQNSLNHLHFPYEWLVSKLSIFRNYWCVLIKLFHFEYYDPYKYVLPKLISVWTNLWFFRSYIY